MELPTEQSPQQHSTPEEVNPPSETGKPKLLLFMQRNPLFVVLVLATVLVICGIAIVGSSSQKKSQYLSSSISSASRPTPVNTPAPTTLPTGEPPTKPPTPTTQYTYTIQSNDDKGDIQNIYALISPKEADKNTAQAIINIILKTCTVHCNISLYDDAKALALDREYINNPEILDEAWMKQNYVFVADHFVAWHEFEVSDAIGYYPYKNDSDYQKYK
jgi:hypothetical protein